MPSALLFNQWIKISNFFLVVTELCMNRGDYCYGSRGGTLYSKILINKLFSWKIAFYFIKAWVFRFSTLGCSVQELCLCVVPFALY